MTAGKSPTRMAFPTRALSRFWTRAALLPAAIVLVVLAAPARASHPGPCHARGQLPDHSCTPGAIETTSLSVVCGTPTHGRRHVDGAVRRRVFLEYGMSNPDERRAFDIDHLVPLELGGSNDLANLWPEGDSDAREKDRVEGALHDRVCRGERTLADAQRAIAIDWTTAR